MKCWDLIFLQFLVKTSFESHDLYMKDDGYMLMQTKIKKVRLNRILVQGQAST